MKISTKGRYALRMLLDMAQHQQEGYVTLKDIAQRQGISKKYLEQIALILGQAGILHGVRGHQGGYRLVGKPAEYTVLEILQAMEGSLAPVACLDQGNNLCSRRHECPTLPLWEGLDAVITNYLRGITLQDVMDGKVQPSQADQA
ncbi:MAG: RrF2 family transcriptional regulator [Eubacteriales bacterium]|nr:RrF2 family transcriptional regulator [Eubacteriales bacterium]